MLIVATIIFYLASYFFWAAKLQGYSHVTKTISEMAETGSGYEVKVGLTFFFPVGFLLAIYSITFSPDSNVSLLAGSLAIGYIGGAFFPIDKNAPSRGTWKNGLHNLFGGFGYIGSIIALGRLEQELGLVSNVVQISIVVFIVFYSLPIIKEYRGIAQRITEIGLFVALFLVAYNA